MANPTPPDIDYSYSGFQAEQQDFPFPGQQLDNDLAELDRASTETITALADVRRADGALKNGIVTEDSLSADVVGLLGGADTFEARAEAVDAAASAEAYAAAAAGSAGNGFRFATRTLMAAAFIPLSVGAVTTQAFANDGDAGGARYVAGAADAPGGVSSNSGTRHWVLDEPIPRIAMFGGFSAASEAAAADIGPQMLLAREYLEGRKQGYVQLDAGHYKTSEPWVPTKPVGIKGVGLNFVALGGIPATTGTTIHWIGTASTIIDYTAVNYGSYLGDFCLRAVSTTAEVAIMVDSCLGMNVERVSLYFSGNKGLVLGGSVQTCSQNFFRQMYIESLTDGHSLVSLEGSYGNACHNTFEQLLGGYKFGRHGIVLRACDNNTFIGPTRMQPYGSNTGYGVFVDATQVPHVSINPIVEGSAPFHPGDNLFLLYEGSWFQPPNLNYPPATVIGYHQGYAPVIGTDGQLPFISGSGMQPNNGADTIMSGVQRIKNVNEIFLGREAPIGSFAVNRIEATFTGNSQRGATFNDLQEASQFDEAIRFYRAGANVGYISTSLTGTQYAVTSDERLKTDDGDMALDDAMDILRRLAVHSFRWKLDDSADNGVFAQELHAVYPLAVVPGNGEPGDEDFRPWSVDYSKLVAPLARAVQGIDARLRAIEAR